MDDPIWNALAREASIAAQHLGEGATLLGKANYAHHAYYGQAFFSLSTGIERAAKLALVVSYALENEGSFPNPKQLRSYGHDLGSLLAAVDEIAIKFDLPPSCRLPNSPISNNIIHVLTQFASNVTRYYNLDFLMNDVHEKAESDPVKSWYELVTKLVLSKHLTEKKRLMIEEHANFASAMMEHFSIVSHTSECGKHMSTVYETSIQTGLTEFAKPFTRMYVLQFGRFFRKTMDRLTDEKYRKRMEFIPHLAEFFDTFNCDDSYFKSRKIWSIYKP